MQEHFGRLKDESNPLVEIINDIIPVLNGRDSSNNIAFLGPNKTIVHRYLVVLYVAKFVPTFTIWGESFGTSTFFTIYSLANVAKAFKRPINFDRTKSATNIYRSAEKKGLVEFKKSVGKTYVTTTPKGDELCLGFLKDFMALARIHRESSSDDRFISKGSSALFLGREASEFYKNLLLRIDELNSGFEEEISSDEGENI